MTGRLSPRVRVRVRARVRPGVHDGQVLAREVVDGLRREVAALPPQR